MKLEMRFSLSHLFFLIALLLTTSTMNSYATTHIIEYGGSHGRTYSPNILSVAVGDSIEWRGDNSSFGDHPLQSVSVPSGAQSFGEISTGTTFTYVVMVAGVYAYQCNFHFDDGMVGSFTATGSASVKKESGNTEISLCPNFPNPVAASTKISYTLQNPAIVSLKVFDINGKDVKNLVNGHQNAGKYEVSCTTDGLVNGTYIYKLQTGDAVLAKQMVVIKQ